MFCTNCGKKAKEGARFCSYCGNQIYIPPTASGVSADEVTMHSHSADAQPRHRIWINLGTSEGHASPLQPEQPEIQPDPVVPEAQPEIQPDPVVPEAQPEIPSDPVVPEAQPEIPSDPVVPEVSETQPEIPSDPVVPEAQPEIQPDPAVPEVSETQPEIPSDPVTPDPVATTLTQKKSKRKIILPIAILACALCLIGGGIFAVKHFGGSGSSSASKSTKGAEKAEGSLSSDKDTDFDTVLDTVLTHLQANYVHQLERDCRKVSDYTDDEKEMFQMTMKRYIIELISPDGTYLNGGPDHETQNQKDTRDEQQLLMAQLMNAGKLDDRDYSWMDDFCVTFCKETTTIGRDFGILNQDDVMNGGELHYDDLYVQLYDSLLVLNESGELFGKLTELD